ncbi:hypothetical protein COU61_03885 [Candidatus Pacearchaeota archaeon CG10_big_fil_rev_8_21_14_0_10_35_13]|nr:MAG: hypothetical protein COU61_03885 [Candidatus Pacearchaeota archaeon CG10_big_fil_rev_8_21_14_0_10_35_13]
MKSDMATDDKREAADKALSNSRDRNDALTQERRFEADKTMGENRARNDEITADRREIKDASSPKWALAILLLVAVLVVGTVLIFL